MSSGDADILRPFHFEGHGVRGAIVRLEASLGVVLGQHFYPAPAAALLGEALAAGVLLGATLKYAGTLSLQAKSEGLLRILFAESSHDNRIRGYARVADAPAGGGFGALLGGGTLAITITPDSGQRYQGIVPLDPAGLAASLEGYFDQSEQLPTLIRLGSDGVAAAGLMLQVLPERAREAGEAGFWEHIAHLVATLQPGELLGNGAETLLWSLFHAEKVRLHDAEPVVFGCRCSVERVQDTLRAVGESEVRSVLAEQGEVQVHCEFCQQEYRFDSRAVASLFGTPEGGPGTRH